MIIQMIRPLLIFIPLTEASHHRVAAMKHLYYIELLLTEK